jgi:hypothetical protein
MDPRRAAIAPVVAASLLGCGLFVDTSDYAFDGGGGTPTTADTSTSTTVSAATTTGVGGEGGAVVTSGMGATTGMGGAGGSACVPQCEAGSCADDGCGNPCPCGNGASCSSSGECCPSTWSVTLPKFGFRLALDSATQALFVGSNDGKVRKLQTCDGAVTAQTTSLASDFAPRALERLGGEILVAGHVPASVQVHRLDATSLGAIDSPVELPAPFSPTSNVIRHGAIGPDGALWVAAVLDGGGIGRFVPGQPPCYQDVFATPEYENRDIARVGDRIIFAISGYSGTTTSFVALDPLNSPQGPCTAASGPTTYPATTSIPRDLIGVGEQLYFAGTDGPVSAYSRGVLGRSKPGGPTVERSYDPTASIDAFTALAHHNGAVYVAGYVGGSMGAEPALTGDFRLLRFADDFTASSAAQVEVSVAGASLARAVLVDADGVYVTGGVEGRVGGFVIKCTHALECPVVTPP